MLTKPSSSTLSSSLSSAPSTLWAEERVEILQQLLPLLLTHIQIPSLNHLEKEEFWSSKNDSDDDPSSQLWQTESGSLSFTQAFARTPTASRFLEFHGAALHWTWQHDYDEDDGRTNSHCCLNFLAIQAAPTSDDVPIQLAKFQWSLEAISSKMSPDENDATGSVSLQSFWKMDRLVLHCVELHNVTLLGTIDGAETKKTTLSLQDGAFLSFSHAQLVNDSLPASAKEHISMAKLVSTLNQWKLPSSRINWKTPLPEYLEQNSTRISTFGDAFRQVYNCLEDWKQQQEKELKRVEAELAKNTNSASSSGIFGMTWKKRNAKSLGDKSSGATPASLSEATATTAAGREDISSLLLATDRETSSTEPSFDANNNGPDENNGQGRGFRTAMTDSLVGTAALVATKASFATPIGAAVTVAAMGVKDGVAAAAAKGRSVRRQASQTSSNNDGSDAPGKEAENNRPQPQDGEDRYRVGDVIRGVSAAAVGVKEGVAAAAAKGRSVRQLNNSSAGQGHNQEKSDSYRVGDVTRGVVASIQERRRNKNMQNRELQGEESSAGGKIGLDKENQKRYASILASSAGAAAGFALAGPVGLLAGSLGGSIATRTAMRNTNSDADVPNETSSSQTTSTTAPPSSAANNTTMDDYDPDEEILRQLGCRRSMEHTLGQTHQQQHQHGGEEEDEKPAPYKFGDYARGIVSRGKQASGRNANAPYQFGDFSRGLFAPKKS